MLNALSLSTVFNYAQQPNIDPKWNPPVTRVIIASKTDDGEDMLSEQVWFKPDETVHAYQESFTKGFTQRTRVTYRRGCRPDNKEDWERLVGLKIQQMV